VIFCDRIMALGFREAFKAGISFGKDDMVVPDSKWKIVADHPRWRRNTSSSTTTA
jgi:DNA-directed RNA polymerase subunit beta'